MNITVLITSENHPINAYLNTWVKKCQNKHSIEVLRSKEDLVGGDILFLISCSEIISEDKRGKFKKTLVIHASDLPKGRGWSPHIWHIINGSEQITLSLLEAEDKIDSGDIWKKMSVNIPVTALYNEINELVFDAELELMDFAIENFHKVVPFKQLDDGASYCEKRTSKDSEIDIYKSIEEQFNLIRVCDPERFPAFFYKNGRKFKIKIEAIDDYIDYD